MRNYTYTHGTFRLFAEEEYEGWVSAVYDLDKRCFVYQSASPFFTSEEAKADALMVFQVLSGNALSDVAWS